MQRLKTDRPIYKIRQRQYGDAEFPLKVRPQDDELLSSWLIRTALEHKTLPATFTNLYLPETRNKLWAGDVDLHADHELLSRLSVKSAMPVEMLQTMTFKAYEGVLFERLYPATGGTPFLLKLVMRGRWSRSPGIRWCPQCLAEDERPYFRKKWRVALFTACLKHRRRLVDRCTCGKPLTLYKVIWRDKMPFCPTCETALVVAGENDSAEVQDGIIEVQEHLQRIVDDGYVLMAATPVYSHLYFVVLHQVMKVMLSRRYGLWFREAIQVETQATVYGYRRLQPFETQEIKKQEVLLEKGVWVLNEWPQRFIDVCERQRLFSSALLQDLERAPFWYWVVIMNKLYHSCREMSEKELGGSVSVWF